MYTRRTFLRVVSGGLAASIPSVHARAATFPERPIRLLIGNPPGGPTDLIARAYATFLSRDLGQPIVVDSRPGANQSIAVMAQLAAPRDGHTMLIATISSMILNPLLQKDNPYKRSDFQAVGLLAETPILLLVGKDVPASSVEEFVSYVRSNPGKLNYGSDGIGSSTHIASASFALKTNTDVVHVPFKGTAELMTALFSNQVQFAFTTGGTQLAGNRDKIKILGITAPKRNSNYPEVPTLEEAGIPDMDFTSWYAVTVAPGVDKSIAERLNESILRASRESKVIETLGKLNMTVRTVGAPAELDKLIDDTYRRLAEVIERSKISML